MHPRVRAATRSRPVLVLALAAAVIVAVPCAQMIRAGEPPRPVDVIVVLGARAYADGTPSQALADRVMTGCDLVRGGLAPRILMSGGPGDGPVHETEAMRRLAIAQGIPENAIETDRTGESTRATALATAAWLRRSGKRTAIVVTHRYHLPRAVREASRAGVEAQGYPARETRLLAKMPLFIAREILGWWASLVW